MAARRSHENTAIQLRQNWHTQELQEKKREMAYIPVLILLATVNQLPTQ